MEKELKVFNRRPLAGIMLLVMILVMTTFFATIFETTSYAASTATYKKVLAAQTALAKAGTIIPVEGVDTNIATVAQNIVNKAISGVTVKVYSSANPQIKGSTIVYGDADASGAVTFSLIAKTSTAKQSVDVVVPAAEQVPVVEDPPVIEPPVTDPTVTEPPAVTDTTAPVLSLPASITSEATGASGAAVNFSATATDDIDGSVPVVCSPSAGSIFAIGVTSVTCTATDSKGNTATGSFNVTVKDTTAPKITAPANISITAATAPATVSIGTATATDAVGVKSITSNAPSSYPAGTTTVTWTAADAAGNKSTAAQTVTVTVTAAETVTYLPTALQADSLVNPAQSLASFLNTCSGKKVVFPAGKTYVLEKQLVIHNVSNLEIDFNGATFKLPANCSIASRSDTGHYVPGNTAVVVHDVTNLSFSNYTIDGNKANIPASTWCTGMAIMNADGFKSYNGAFKNSNYHQLVMGPTNVSTYNKNISFTKTYFKDHGGADGGAGISDVYINNRSTDSFSFIDVTVDNTALKDYAQQAQCFYVAGFNGYFEDVVTNNCAVPLDVRYGTHVAKDFTVTNAERVLMVQPYPGGNGTNGYAKLTASNFTGKGIRGSVDGANGLYIIACDRVTLDNFNIEMDPTATYAWYGIRIRQFYAEYPISNVSITNTTVKNFKTAGVLMENLTATSNFNTMTLTGASSSAYGVRSTACTAYQYFTNLITSNCIKSSSTDGMIKLQ